MDAVLTLHTITDSYFIQLSDAENSGDIQNIFAMDEAMDLLMSTGFRKPVVSLTLEDCPHLISVLLLDGKGQSRDGSVHRWIENFECFECNQGQFRTI